MINKFDLIVIGGGHAGIEAALISSKMNLKVALLTLEKEKIGLMPCNPSIGGAAKGIVVRDIDALGGEMGKAADATALQFKLLGTSGGPAVQALRVQSDKIGYSKYMQKVIENQKNLSVIEGSVEELIIKKKKIKGVILRNRNSELSRIFSEAVILTTGTYLRPLTYRGLEKKTEGPDGQKNVINSISTQLSHQGFNFKRFKTGTSPRILTKSIDFSKLNKEPGTNLPLRFSSWSDQKKIIPFSEQLPCYLLHTNKITHEIIKKNSHLSPIFSNPDMGTGPRYCPSIEDKIFRFSDKDKHQIFLEPESLEMDTTYIQGLSTSLPEEIQSEILKTLPGLENSRVKKWGYAIEYDVIESTQLKITLETKLIEGLFTAGQINGTTGYEEAAAQGLIAGINAALKIKKKDPLILRRDQSYIGVMIDDLVTKEINDPYRLLTSRAEYRLLLRHDNSLTRLLPITKELELVSSSNWENFLEKSRLKETILDKLKIIKISREEIGNSFLKIDISQWKTIKYCRLYDLLKNDEFNLNDFAKMIPEIEKLDWEEKREIEIDAKYEGYIKKQNEEVKEMKILEEEKIPQDIDYSQVKNLAKEAKEKLSKIKPFSFRQAMSIGGVNPTDIKFLRIFLKTKMAVS